MSLARGRPHPLLAALVCLGPVLAAAQNAPPASSQNQPGTYLDREIEGLSPDVAPANGQPLHYDADGLPRFLRLETRLGTQPFDTERRTRLGYAVFGLLETPNHGTLSLDGSYAPQAGRGTLTLRQRGLPWTGGWQANHELGVISTLAPDVSHQPSRIYVPSAILQGLSAEWENPGKGLQLQAVTGQPGRLEGLPTSGFRTLAGRRSSLGVQWHANADAGATDPLLGWTMALRHEDATGVSALDQPTLASDFVDANSTQLVLRHATSDLRIQGQMINTQASNLNGSRNGLWLDAEWDDGPRTHGLGLFRLDPDLSWAQQPMPSDIAGTYFRTSWRTRQWSAEASIDWLHAVSGRASNGLYATGSARWRLGRGSSLGTGLSVRDYDGRAWDSYGDWRWQNDWGTSGLRLELAGGQNQVGSQKLIYDQDWTVPQGYSLSTSLGLGRLGASSATGEAAQSLWSGALNLGAPLSSNAELRASVNTEQGSGNSRRWGLNLGANWRINTHWSLEGQFNRSSGQSLTPVSINPLAPPLPAVTTNADRSFYAVLRYEQQAGSRSAPLGGQAQDGGGRVEGTVYFDANRSGTQEASESGAPGVTVYLDNRYAVRTDAQGRFEFPFVGSGPRTVGVRNETLPLPWTVVDEGQVKIDVRLRETTRLSIPVQRSSGN